MPDFIKVQLSGRHHGRLDVYVCARRGCVRAKPQCEFQTQLSFHNPHTPTTGLSRDWLLGPGTRVADFMAIRRKG